jgi:type III secretory pathway component EscS
MRRSKAFWVGVVVGTAKVAVSVLIGLLVSEDLMREPKW